MQNLEDIPRWAVLDGGLATTIMDISPESLKLDDPLWSSRLLVQDQDVLKMAHRRFLELGADIIETATYQASVELFTKTLGCSEAQALEYLKRGVELAREAINEYCTSHPDNHRKPLVGGSIGPYGACLCDRSEYHGRYVDNMSIEELQTWHRPRIKALLEAGADILCVETIPAEKEATAVATLLRDEFPEASAYVSFSCKDSEHTCHGEKLADASKVSLLSDNIFGAGINCVSPNHVEGLLNNIPREVKESKIIVVYPNSGESWTQDKQWFKEDTNPSDPEAWMAAGATWIGGCCRVTPKDLTSTAEVVHKHCKK